jgi:hypothetical protein
MLRTTSDQCCKFQAEALLDAANDQVIRSQLLATYSQGSGDWLDALPLSNVGLNMDNATVRVAAGLRLGAPVVSASRMHLRLSGDDRRTSWSILPPQI